MPKLMMKIHVNGKKSCWVPIGRSQGVGDNVEVDGEDNVVTLLNRVQAQAGALVELDTMAGAPVEL
jgi:hypothetical protein